MIYKPKQFETPDIKRFTDKPTVFRPTFINYSRLPIELHPYARKIQKKRKFKPKILPQEIPTEENAELETKGTAQVYLPTIAVGRNCLEEIILEIHSIIQAQ